MLVLLELLDAPLGEPQERHDHEHRSDDQQDLVPSALVGEEGGGDGHDRVGFGEAAVRREWPGVVGGGQATRSTSRTSSFSWLSSSKSPAWSAVNVNVSVWPAGISTPSPRS